MLAPPFLEGWPLLRGILDPPLIVAPKNSGFLFLLSATVVVER